MVNPVQYVREVIQELRRVSWPSLKTTGAMTALVITVSVIVGLYIAGLDLILQRALRLLIG